jgi:nucleoside-diphosphate-sugar epimerase
MDVLVIGGTGLISVGIVRQLQARGAAVTVYNRGRRPPLAGVRHIEGDRQDRGAFERACASCRQDVVIDMIGFSEADAESTIRAVGGRCQHLIFCSTVCTYGAGIARQVLIDETFPQDPVTPYGREKVACERRLARAAAEGQFALTIIRPSQTYGPGGPLIDQLELDGPAWDRVARGLPVLCAGDGLGLWQATHRDDVGTLFAHAALDPGTYGQAYNATRDEVLTWRDYYRQAAAALDTRALLIHAPAGWLIRERPGRFGFLAEVTRHHGAYSSAKARAHVPAFRAEIDLETGARQTFADIRRRGAWRDSRADHDYQALVDQALAAGFEVSEA